MSYSTQIRTYSRKDSVTFRKTSEAFGGLSNMAPGYPLHVNGTIILTAEALYQACRFPHRPEIQRLIIEQRSPMTAKMKSKPYRKDSRPDWDRVRIKVMRWCLYLKLAQHWKKFSRLLLSTGDLPIVEDSRKDDFWGAKAADSNTLVGMNVLGRLLMGLREGIKQGAEFRLVEPPAIPNFLLFGEPLKVMDFHTDKNTYPVVTATPSKKVVVQLTLPFFADNAAATSTDGTYHIDTGMHVEKKQALVEGLKPYAEYKYSGHEWLGDIPAHWDVRRSKLLLREVDSRSITGKEKLLRVSQYTGVTQRKAAAGSDTPDTRAASLVGYKRVAVNDLVINIMLAWNGSLGASRYDGIVSPAYCVYRFKKDALPWYFHKLFRIPLYKGRIKTASTGVVESRLRLYSDDLGRIETLLPPFDEQAAIVRFLDHANRKIDGFIRAKRKLIGLLNEQKQAIIHRAVTRGLNPNVPLKPSGIPWLGEIPVNWDIRPLKQSLSRMDYGTSESSKANGKFRVLTMGHIQNGRVLVPETGGIDHIPAGLFLETNDLLFNRTNSPELVGKVGIFTGNKESPVTFASYLVRLRVRPEHNSHWLNYLLNSFRFWAFARSQALVSLHQANLNSSRYGRMNIPVPPRVDQDSIVEQINEQTGAIDTAIARTEREIALMQEYRTRLSTDIVTGKLDVREAAAKLPELPPDATPELAAAEPLDESENEDSHE